MHKIFVYGTLCYDVCLNGVLRSENKEKKPATLLEYKKRGLNILPESDSKVEGYVISVDETELERLDRYEGTGSLYKMIDVDVNGFEDVRAYQLI